MAEIQARIERAFPKAETIQVGSAPLQGSIQGSGLQPFNPFTDGSVRKLEAPEDLKRMIVDAAQRAGVDPVLFDALVASESSYDPNARSYAGAMGLTQLMPGTAKSLGVSNPFDPVSNLDGGAKYLSQMMSRFGGDVKLALAAYNAGPGAVEKYNGIPPYAQTQAYVQKIMERMSRAGQP